MIIYGNKKINMIQISFISNLVTRSIRPLINSIKLRKTAYKMHA